MDHEFASAKDACQGAAGRRRYIQLKLKVADRMLIATPRLQPRPYNTRADGTKKGAKSAMSMGLHRSIALVNYERPPDDSPRTLHICGKPACCNPGHILWGSSAVNYDNWLSTRRPVQAAARAVAGLSER
jgi:hypothetical protein